MTEQRSVVVTGAASGFGREIARTFARDGARVCVVDRDLEGANAVAKELPGAIALGVDVTDPGQLAGMIDAALEAFGRLDVVVSNAGAGHVVKPMVELDTAVFDAQYALNLRAHVLTVGYAAPRMTEGGAIINVASMGGRRPRPFSTVYNSAKGGLIAFTAALAPEIAPRLRTYVVNPTGADTPFLAKTLGPAGLTPEARAAVVAGIPMKRLATPEDIANAVVYLASPGCGVASGSFLDIDGGRSIQ